MPINVATDLVLIDNCSSITNWSANSIEVYNDFYIEGTSSLGAALRTVGNNDFTRSNLNLNLTNTHLRIWVNTNTSSGMNTKANGGLQVFIGDGTNTGYWYLEGADTYAGGWIQLVVDTQSTPNAGTIPNWSAITTIGIRINLLSQQRNVDNTWVDGVRHGNKLIITGGTQSNPGTFEEIYQIDKANAYGIVSKKGGVYYIRGTLQFGNGVTDTYFKDSGQIIVFEDIPVNANAYNINIVGGSGVVTDFQLGEKSGTSGINGCFISTAGTKQFAFNANDSNINFKLYGTTIKNASTISLPPDSVNNEILNCSFDKCGEILANTCKIQNSTISNALNRGIRIDSVSHNVSGVSIISCVHGIHFPNTGTYTLDNIKFLSNTYDIENSSTGSLILNLINGSNASTYENTGGGTTTINNSVPITIRGVKTGAEPVDYVRVRVEKISDGTAILSDYANQTDELNSGYYKATTTYNYLGDVSVIIKARYKGYLPFVTTGTITSSGLDVTAVWIKDSIAT
ncbi:MAG: hypothetical protein KatS3mg002_0313 [Candidatus Woesearchaeota archaeon]|nr:MAG: hypothetical protein KatS3mg002_0313 [Candidatus Woesearchaeota archaeon]